MTILIWHTFNREVDDLVSKMGKASNGNSTTSSSVATTSEVVKSSWMTKRSQLKSRFSFTNYRDGEHDVLGCSMQL